jgi:hypothetical protein
MGLKLALRTLNTGRLTLPAACAGMGKQCLSMARRWGAKRVQWGLAVGEHEAGRQKLADIAATTLAMEAVTWLTSNWADDGRDIRIEAAMAKLFCSEAAWRLVDETLQLRGGRGYERADSLRARGEDPYPVERLMRDCRINTIIEGTSEIMRLYLAREALDPHLRRAMDLMRPGMKLGAKLKTAAALAGHYALWYPRHAVSRRLSMAGGFGRLGRHDRYVNRQSHRLATRLVGAMARHQARLERRRSSSPWRRRAPMPGTSRGTAAARATRSSWPTPSAARPATASAPIGAIWPRRRCAGTTRWPPVS